MTMRDECLACGATHASDALCPPGKLADRLAFSLGAPPLRLTASGGGVPDGERSIELPHAVLVGRAEIDAVVRRLRDSARDSE